MNVVAGATNPPRSRPLRYRSGHLGRLWRAMAAAAAAVVAAVVAGAGAGAAVVAGAAAVAGLLVVS